MNVVQIEQDIAVCANKFPWLDICRPIAAQFMDGGIIALFEFEQPAILPLGSARKSIANSSLLKGSRKKTSKVTGSALPIELVEHHPGGCSLRRRLLRDKRWLRSHSRPPTDPCTRLCTWTAPMSPAASPFIRSSMCRSRIMVEILGSSERETLVRSTYAIEYMMTASGMMRSQRCCFIALARTGREWMSTSSIGDALPVAFEVFFRDFFRRDEFVMLFRADPDGAVGLLKFK